MSTGPPFKPTKAEIIAILTGHYRVSEKEIVELLNKYFVKSDNTVIVPPGNL